MWTRAEDDDATVVIQPHSVYEWLRIRREAKVDAQRARREMEACSRRERERARQEQEEFEAQVRFEAPSTTSSNGSWRWLLGVGIGGALLLASFLLLGRQDTRVPTRSSPHKYCEILNAVNTTLLMYCTVRVAFL